MTRSTPIRWPSPGQTVYVPHPTTVKAIFPKFGAIDTTSGRYYAWVLGPRVIGRVKATPIHDVTSRARNTSRQSQTL